MAMQGPYCLNLNLLLTLPIGISPLYLPGFVMGPVANKRSESLY